jgi:hypothetical protein
MGALYVASDPRPVISTHESNRLSRAGNFEDAMKEQRKHAVQLEDTETLRSIPVLEVADGEVAEGEETQRLRSLTVQEVEEILRKEPQK